MRYKQEKTGQNMEKKSRQENKNGQWRIMTTDQPLVRGGEVGIAPKVVITEQLPHHELPCMSASKCLTTNAETDNDPGGSMENIDHK